MATEELRLIEPALEFESEFRDFAAEFPHPSDIEGAGGLDPDHFAAGVRQCLDYAQGRNLPGHWVPAHVFWLVREPGRILGTINIRHRLNDALSREGGHIGYAVRPSERRRGYATFMLRGALAWMRDNLSLDRVLVTCDRENQASAGVIRKCGGVWQDEVASQYPGRAFTQRYWIDL